MNPATGLTHYPGTTAGAAATAEHDEEAAVPVRAVFLEVRGGSIPIPKESQFRLPYVDFLKA